MGTSVAAYSLDEPAMLDAGFRSERRLLAWGALLAAAMVVVLAGLAVSFYRYAEAVPLSCPEGSSLVGDIPPRGLEQWCEQDGERHGPYRRWHPTKTQIFRGRVQPTPLVSGAYARGARIGVWTEVSLDGTFTVETFYAAGAMLHAAHHSSIGSDDEGPSVVIEVESVRPARSGG